MLSSTTNRHIIKRLSKVGKAAVDDRKIIGMVVGIEHRRRRLCLNQTGNRPLDVCQALRDNQRHLIHLVRRNI